MQPNGEQSFVTFTPLTNEDTELEEQMNESLTLQFIPTPATLQTMPIGAGVFFKQEIPLTILDVNRKYTILLLKFSPSNYYSAPFIE